MYLRFELTSIVSQVKRELHPWPHGVAHVDKIHTKKRDSCRRGGDKKDWDYKYVVTYTIYIHEGQQWNNIRLNH